MEGLLTGYREGEDWDAEEEHTGDEVEKEVVAPFDRGKLWEVRWDGSFGQDTGAGIGVTISRDGLTILEASIPVYATDATRCESLGPAIASLLL